jgi:alginate O-acetyltransferase complex protein AlgI
MLFNSLQFAVFFPVAVALYFALPRRLKTLTLLLLSCVFYMAFIPSYIVILGVTIAIDYAAGIWLERVDGSKRRFVLGLSIVSTCIVLFVFKYFNFFVSTFVGFGRLLGWQLPDATVSLILPIGLSFHTFQSLSYVIEVYRGHQKAERDVITYATYVMFFPQLVAGPIERPQNLLHQFYESHSFEHQRVASGLKRMAWGFFKKLVVADRLALYVNDVFSRPHEHNGLQLTIASVFFAYQIYCDFSGYSDIAIGAARVLGFRLMENFRTPYWSVTVSEFWQRWHISLSTWFRDYLFTPLGGAWVKRPRLLMNLLITFTISGLWHGANWTYVAWGAINGAYIAIGILTKSTRDKGYRLIGIGKTSLIRTAIGIATTFTLTTAALVFFRANSFSDALYVLSHWFRNWDFGNVRTEQFLLRQMPVAILSIGFVEAVQYLHSRGALTRSLARYPSTIRWPVYIGFTLAVVLLGVYRSSQFIYFQF